MHEQAALTAGRHRHVPADQEREPAEHLLLGHGGLGGDQLADAVGEVLVVGHARGVSERRRVPGDRFDHARVVRRLHAMAGTQAIEIGE